MENKNYKEEAIKRVLAEAEIMRGTWSRKTSEWLIENAYEVACQDTVAYIFCHYPDVLKLDNETYEKIASYPKGFLKQFYEYYLSREPAYVNLFDYEQINDLIEDFFASEQDDNL